MIHIEQQVTSLEVSQKLKSLGVPQGESYFVWITTPDTEEIVIERWMIKTVRQKILCDAFTLTELLNFKVKDKSLFISFDKSAPYCLENLIPDKLAEDIEEIIKHVTYYRINPQDLKL